MRNIILKWIFILIFLFFSGILKSQVYPTFSQHIPVSIMGLTFDAMEPFISPIDSTLFSNSRNAGGNTNLYYATFNSNTSFDLQGLVSGTYDSTANHLDAVASMDTSGNFFWVSMRNYPVQMENLHHGIYSNGNVTSINRVYGDFNMYLFNPPFGWLIMDAAINWSGDHLYYCNAQFDFNQTSCAGLPCEAKLGVAEKVNDSTFNKLPDSDGIFSNINDSLYLVYAPFVSSDEKELYFTRLMKGTSLTEICVSVRNSPMDTFSVPHLIYGSNINFPEACALSRNGQRLYFHEIDVNGYYHIFMMNRNGTIDIEDELQKSGPIVYPNPSSGVFQVKLPEGRFPEKVELVTLAGDAFNLHHSGGEVNASSFSGGIYVLKIYSEDRVYTKKIILW